MLHEQVVIGIGYSIVPFIVELLLNISISVIFIGGMILLLLNSTIESIFDVSATNNSDNHNNNNVGGNNRNNNKTKANNQFENNGNNNSNNLNNSYSDISERERDGQIQECCYPLKYDNKNKCRKNQRQTDLTYVYRHFYCIW